MRLAPSQASPGTPAQRIERKLSAVYAARHPTAIRTAERDLGADGGALPASAIASSASTIRPPGAQWVSGVAGLIRGPHHHQRERAEGGHRGGGFAQERNRPRCHPGSEPTDRPLGLLA